MDRPRMRDEYVLDGMCKFNNRFSFKSIDQYGKTFTIIWDNHLQKPTKSDEILNLFCWSQMEEFDKTYSSTTKK